MRYYRIIGKGKFTGNFLYTSWYTQNTLISTVARQVEWMQELAYDVQVEYSEEVSE